MSKENSLSRRERQIMDALYTKREASAQEVLDSIPEPPSYSSVRALLARLLDKKVIGKRQEGSKYIYFPLEDKSDASQNALKRVVSTFFEGSAAKAVNALLGSNDNNLTEEEIKSIKKAINKLKHDQ